MSSDRSEDEDNDAISKQIVDYYRKYSQNKHLPKYFSGTALSYMPPIVPNEQIASYSKPTIIIDDTNSETLVEKSAPTPVKLDEHVEPKPLSPTSSITSNRKLEWDNGADIGYNNCNKSTNLHKSLSLPILLTSVDNKNVKATKTKLSSQIVTVISYLSGDDDCPDNKHTQISSSSSSSYPADVPIESSSSSSRTNPKKVSTTSSSFTNTIAYLKSKIGSPDAESTPKVASDGNLYIDTPIVPKQKARIKHRSINLCVTKPIVIHCLDNQKKKGYDKKIQTSFAEGVSMGVQTSDSLEKIIDKQEKQEQKPQENQSVILINYDSGSDKRTYSSNTQTDAELIASQCDSFEYYRQEKAQNSKNDDLKTSSKSHMSGSTNSSKDVPVLGQLITEQQSASLIRDVDKSIDLLQKLLKSKKYDAATKKRYVKKIVDKIVNTKYSEDSTTSSELFVPKRQQKTEGIPWQALPSPKFTIKTFSEEFLPSDTVTKTKKRSVLTAAQQQNVAPSVLDTVGTRTSFEKQQNLSSGTYQSWKDDKTESERLLEQKQCGQGDQLIKFAMKERQHQIAWINDEISHLTKLKGLLEKKIQKTTTVYMVSHDQSNRNACSPRNYVIETEVSSSMSSGTPVDYNLCDNWGNRRNYCVKEVSAKPDMNTNRKIVRDIEVVSDDKTTNIRVGAKKVEVNYNNEFNPRPPILMGTGKYDTFPRSRAEEERCWTSQRLRSTNQFSTAEHHNENVHPFDVALNRNTNPTAQIQEIINKYTRGQSTNQFSHPCKCTDLLIKSAEPRQAFNHKVDKKISPACACCKCKEKVSPIQAVTPHDLKVTEPISHLNVTATLKPPCTCCKCQQYKESAARASSTVENSNCQTENCVCFDKEIQTEYHTSTVGASTLPASALTVSALPTSALPASALPASALTASALPPVETYHTKTSSEDSSSSSYSSSETISSTTSVQSCLCCKRKNVTSKRLYKLRQKLSDEVYPLCRPCYRQQRNGGFSASCYTNATHVCNCYTVVKTNTLNEIKNTINDLNELEEYCTCVNPDNRNSSEYCKHCKCKLQKTSKNRNGIAYTITFDETLQEKKKKKKKPQLEEIKIKIPVSYKKKRKDKENKRRKSRQTDDSEEASANEVRNKPWGALQDYLVTNRPDFVEGAEERRKTVNESKAIREELSEYNKLMFLKKCQEECEKKAKRLFSGKEMKEITKRNYKKLPEVQQKLHDNRERELRQASRLMADTFNRKLRENVLKGKRNLCTNAKVINI